MPRAVRSLFVCLAMSAGVFAPAATASAQSTVLVFDSQPGDYIGAGQRRTYTTADAPFTVTRNNQQGLSFSINPPDFAFWWTLNFSAANGVRLAVGSYRGARRYPFSHFNGLDVSGSGRGCNQLTGRFDVREVAYADDGTVLRFAADFEQHCEDGVPALFGAIRYHSTISDAVPFGGRYPSYDLTILPAPGGIVYGENLACGNGSVNCAVSLRAPAFSLLKAVPNPGYQLLGWSGECGGGDVINVLVHASKLCAPVFGPDVPGGARNGFMLDSQSGDYIGGGRQQRYTDSTSRWSAYPENGGNLVRFVSYGNDGSDTTVAFRAPGAYTNRLVPGEYNGATRASFSYPAPGLDAYGNGRGCNTIAGRFTIYESVYNPDGSMASFAADFEQHCDGLAPGLFGSVRYNSSVAGVVPYGGAYPAFRVTTLPSPYGRVTGPGIDCEFGFARCTATRSSAGPLTLTASALAGYRLDQWIGDCSGSSASTTVEVNTSNTICIARFVPTSIDTAAPVLSRVPGDQYAATPSSSATGAVVTWMPPLAADAVDGPVAVACAPASGTMFPVGTTTVGCSALDRSGNQAATSFTVSVTRRGPGVDLNGDGQADLLWRNADGQVAVWLMNGMTRTSTTFVGTVSTDWRIAAVGDFTGDGNADIVWQQDTGMVVLWEMQGVSRVRTHTLYNGYTAWRVSAAADLNRDGQLDLIWQGPSGNVAAWMMHGLTENSVEFLYDADIAWRVVAAADLDGDGFADLIWQSPSGSVAAWLMDGTVRRDVAWLFTGDTDWRIEGIANLNGDNSVDLVWQSPFGTVYAWMMAGVERTSVYPLYEGGTGWRVSGPR